MEAARLSEHDCDSLLIPKLLTLIILLEGVPRELLARGRGRNPEERVENRPLDKKNN